MEQELSHSEFMEWIAFSRIEPIGDSRLDYLLGMVQHTQIACHSTTKYKLSDFVPDWLGEKNKPATAEQMAAAFATMGKNVKVVKNG